MTRPRLFSGMTPQKRQNLGLMLMLTFYALLAGIYLMNADQAKLCEGLGYDYCAFWSAGRIINEQGVGAVYDLEVMTEFQRSVYPGADSPGFETVAVMYPPPFILPFAALARLSLPLSFWLWSLVNFAGLILYLRFFAKNLVGTPPPLRVMLMLTLSLPVLMNFFYGQVNLWLVICIGEFLRASRAGKPLKAGLWLGGLLLKPQLLVLILPILLFRKAFKTLAGFAATAGAIGLASFALLGTSGLMRLWETLTAAGGGDVQSNPFIMMNWRMLGEHLNTVAPPAVGWGVALLGMLLTAGASLIVFSRVHTPNEDLDSIAMLGTLAATAAFTWHAHFSAAMILIPPMLLVLIEGRFSQRVFSAWVFTPPLILFLMIALNILVGVSDQAVQLVNGIRGLALNLLVLGWAILQTTYIRKIPQKGEANEL